MGNGFLVLFYYSPGKKDNNGKLSFDQRVPDTGGCTFAATMSPTVILLPVGRPSRRPKGPNRFLHEILYRTFVVSHLGHGEM